MHARPGRQSRAHAAAKPENPGQHQEVGEEPHRASPPGAGLLGRGTGGDWYKHSEGLGQATSSGCGRGSRV
eukprot:4857084-Amphidinium_carterae.1